MIFWKMLSAIIAIGMALRSGGGYHSGPHAQEKGTAMPWVVGIDEAGYGPNLGPLAQAAVAVKLPDGDPGGWETLKAHVRRAAEKDRKRVLIDDSKLVHQGKNGLAKLERGLTAVFGPPGGPCGDWLAGVALQGVLDDLVAEAWFDAAELLPLHPDPVTDLRPSLAELGIEARVVGLKLVPAPIFNKVVNASGTKATILSIGLIGLMTAAHHSLPPGDGVAFVCDQLGGRMKYAPVLQSAFADGWVVTEAEVPGESRYRVESLGRDVTATFRPRADCESVAVALASMLCKYAREVCMRQFNRYWARHVPDLKPTAGYPTDAKRFFDAIRPTFEKLGLSEEDVWRVK
jgi:hypothetical protein